MVAVSEGFKMPEPRRPSKKQRRRIGRFIRRYEKRNVWARGFAKARRAQTEACRGFAMSVLGETERAIGERAPTLTIYDDLGL